MIGFPEFILDPKELDDVYDGVSTRQVQQIERWSRQTCGGDKRMKHTDRLILDVVNELQTNM